MQDIFVLVANEQEYKRIEQNYPWVMPVTGFTVTEDMLRNIVAFCTSDYFYLIYPALVDIVRGDWKPDEHEQHYVHIADNTFDTRVYNRRDVASAPHLYTDEALIASTELLKNQPGVRLRNPWPVYEDEEVGHKECVQPYFWVKNRYVDSVVDLRFTPSYWHANRVHEWKQQSPLRDVYDYGSIKLVPTGLRNTKPVLTGEVGCLDKQFPTFPIEGLQGEIPEHDAEMTYIYDPRYVKDKDAFNYYPPPHDRNMLHVWRANSGHVAICLVPKVPSIGTKEMNHAWARFPSLRVFLDHKDAILKPQGNAWYWLLKPGHALLEDFDRKLLYSNDPSKWETNELWEPNTVVEFGNYDQNGDRFPVSGLRLMPPKVNENTEVLKSARYATKIKPFDIIYLSYHEPYADENFERLKQRFPQAQHVKNIKGIFNAHQMAAAIAESLMFYVVDADAIILDDFDFSFVPNPYEYDVTHVWKARNPINGLEYGYGGVKLFPTQALRDATNWHIDFTTSVGYGFKGINQVSNVTQFNTDPFNTWKSAFRECVKLASKIIKNQNDLETEERLSIWQTVKNDAPFADYCIAGAIAGSIYGKQYKDNPEALDKINDFEWLQTEFRKCNGQKT
jgi:hypothetical protein